MTGKSVCATGGSVMRSPEGPAEGKRARCVLCGEDTEHAASVKGATLCPVCEWQEAQRVACSG